MTPPLVPQRLPTRLRLILVALVSLLVALVVAGVMLWLRPPAPTQQGATPPGVMNLPAGTELGGPFKLVDQNGRAVTDATYAGKFMLVFFGFTHCPDVCPTELQVMATVMDDLGAQAERVQPIFISVDPERDTPEALKGYVAAFHPSIVGLTGAPEDIAAVAKSYRVYYAKAPTGGAGEYTMDHTAFTYLMGPDGKLRSVFRGGAGPEAFTAEIRKQLAR